MTTEVKEIDTAKVVVQKEGSNDNDDANVATIRTFSLSTNGVTVHVSNVGASITKIRIPNFANEKGDNDDDEDDVVLGYKSAVDMYTSRNPPYLGVIVGRVANRIAKGRFSLEEEEEEDHGGTAEYNLATNNGPNHLHGGDDGFSHRIWDAEVVVADSNGDSPSIQLTLVSQDGDQGYPGSVEVQVTYSLVAATKDPKKGATLTVDMTGRLLEDCDHKAKTSPLSLANHTYFNLAGHSHGAGILDHRLTMPCDAYTPVDSTSIPTRHVRSLDQDAIMDWRSPGRILREALMDFGTEKAGLSEEQVQQHLQMSRCSPDGLAKAGYKCSNPNEPYGFDHNYVVLRKKKDASTSSAADDAEDGSLLNLVGTLEHKGSARRLSVRTDAPGVQLYTANWLDGSHSEISKDGAAYGQWQGLCLETQTYPDGILPNEKDHPDFAKGKCFILRPEGPEYKHRVEYSFESM
jgi:aldose 1-epimerase